MKKHGRGLVIGDGDTLWVKASSVDRVLSRQKLEKQLGVFTAAPDFFSQAFANKQEAKQKSSNTISPTPSWKVFLQGQSEKDEVIRGIIEGNRKAAGWVNKTLRRDLRKKP